MLGGRLVRSLGQLALRSAASLSVDADLSMRLTSRTCVDQFLPNTITPKSFLSTRPQFSALSCLALCEPSRSLRKRNPLLENFGARLYSHEGQDTSSTPQKPGEHPNVTASRLEVEKAQQALNVPSLSPADQNRRRAQLKMAKLRLSISQLEIKIQSLENVIDWNRPKDFEFEIQLQKEARQQIKDEQAELAALIAATPQFPLDSAENIILSMRDLAAANPDKLHLKKDFCSPHKFDANPLRRFLDREDTLDTAARLLIQDPPATYRHPLVIAQAAPGCGKSAFTDHLALRIGQEESFLAVPVSFNSHTSELQIMNRLTYAENLAARALYSVFFQFEYDPDDSKWMRLPTSDSTEWSAFVDALGVSSFHNLKLRDVLEAALKITGKTKLVLLIDETSKAKGRPNDRQPELVINDKSTDETETLEAVKNVVKAACEACNSLSALAKHCGLFLTSLNGLFNGIVVADSGRDILPISLPLLKPESVDHLFQLNCPEWSDKVHLRNAIAAHTAGHPRLISIIIGIKAQYQATAHSHTYGDLLTLIRESRKAMSLDNQKLVNIRCALLGEQVAADDLVPVQSGTTPLTYRMLNTAGRLLAKDTALVKTKNEENPFVPVAPLLPLYFHASVNLAKGTHKEISCETALYDLLNQAFKLHVADGVHKTWGDGFEKFHGYWEVLTRRLITLDPTPKEPRTWKSHYRSTSRQESDFHLPRKHLARFLALERKQPGPSNGSQPRTLDDLVAIMNRKTKQLDCYEVIGTDCGTPTVSLAGALEQKASLVIWMGADNCMNFFDLLAIDWTSNGPHFTFIQTKFSQPGAKAYILKKEVNDYVEGLRRQLAPYVADSPNLFAPKSQQPLPINAEQKVQKLLPNVDSLTARQMHFAFIGARQLEAGLDKEAFRNVVVVDLVQSEAIYASLFPLVRLFHPTSGAPTFHQDPADETN